MNTTHAYLITVLFPIWVYEYALFFYDLRSVFFSQGIVRYQCFLSMQRYDFKNSIKLLSCYEFKSVFYLRLISK